MPPSREFIMSHLFDTLDKIESISGHKPMRHGKVRDTFEIQDQMILVATDRQSAFDRILASVPFKGQVLNRISAFWFDATKDIVANHVIAIPDANVLIAKKAKVFPVEVVVRGFLTGSTDTSIWMNYKKGIREFGGITLPDGLNKNFKFDKPILTPTTKSDEHDRPITSEEIVSQGLVEKKKWDFIAKKALEIFQRGSEICAKRGLVLVDTKFEFGEDKDGNIMLIDEVLTPDSSRFWLAEDFEERIGRGEEPKSFDKEFLRLWFVNNCDPYHDKVLPKAPDELVAELALRYIEAFEKITGEKFEPMMSEPTMIARIEKNIMKYIEN